MNLPSSLRGWTALVTGASSGLGESYARTFASQGCALILVARRLERLEKLKSELQATHGVLIEILDQDLSVPGAASILASRLPEGTTVDILINNAGFGLFESFAGSELASQEAMMRLNMETVVALSHICLPGMLERHQGLIVNIASTTAFQPIPGMALYAATKTFVVNFTEALSAEIEDPAVHVMVVCPGATRTEFQSHSHTEGMAPSWAYQTPDQVVQTTLAGWGRHRALRISGLHNVLGAIAPRFFPRAIVVQVIKWIFQLASARASTKFRRS